MNARYRMLALWIGCAGAAGGVGADILDADIRRTEAGWLVLRASLSDATSPNIRWLIDGAAGAGEPRTGADFMVEGDRAFRYPQGAADWSWNEADPPLTITANEERYWILREPPFASEFRWQVAVYDEAWNLQSRFPVSRDAVFDPEKAPRWRYPERLFPENIDDLKACLPTSLSFRLDAELKNKAWEKPGAPVPPVWKPPRAPAAGYPLRVFLVDMTNGARTDISLDTARICSNSILWTGETNCVRWSLAVESVEPGVLDLSVLLQSPVERCVSLGVGFTMDQSVWTWHDDLYGRRLISSDSRRYENSVKSAYGRRGLQSIYPFGAISSAGTALAVETDPNEPRVYQILADTAYRFMGFLYDVALTPETSNFPGRAAFRCRFSEMDTQGRDAFRVTLGDFLRRHPDYGLARLSAAGVGGALPDILAISNRQDFGFAFGWLGADPAPASGPAEDLTLFMPSAPWSFSLPLDARWTWTESDVREWLRLLMAVNPEASAGYMSAALLGGAPNAGEAPSVNWLRDENGLTAAMELNADPDLMPTTAYPLSPAMVEWRLIRSLSAEGAVQGVDVRDFGGLRGLDVRPAALRVTDHPCVFTTQAVLRAGVALPHAALEFLSAAAGCLRRDSRYLMGTVDLDSLPFFIRYLDVPVMNMDASAEEADPAVAERRWAALRAMSGAKPVCAPWRCPPAKANPEDVEEYLDRCSAFGFLPGFAGDASGDSVWRHPEVYERLRNLFRTRLPIVRRQAFAGWRADGLARASLPEIVVEQFGDGESALGHIALRNLSSVPVEFDLLLPAPGTTTVLLDPLSGWCRTLPPAAAASDSIAVRLTLAGQAVRVLDLVPAAARGQEALFFESWATTGREAEAGLRNLKSMDTEMGERLLAYVNWVIPAVKGEDNRLVVYLQNAGQTPVQISGFKAIASKQYRDAEPAGMTLAAGESRTLEVPFYANDVADNPWLEAQWEMVRAGRTTLCERLFQPGFVEPLDIRLERDGLTMEGDLAFLNVIVRNNSSQNRSVHVRVQGDVQGAQGPVELRSANSAKVSILLKHPRREARRCTVTLMEDGEKLAEKNLPLSP